MNRSLLESYTLVHFTFSKHGSTFSSIHNANFLVISERLESHVGQHVGLLEHIGYQPRLSTAVDIIFMKLFHHTWVPFEGNTPLKLNLRISQSVPSMHAIHE